MGRVKFFRDLLGLSPSPDHYGWKLPDKLKDYMQDAAEEAEDVKVGLTNMLTGMERGFDLNNRMPIAEGTYKASITSWEIRRRPRVSPQHPDTTNYVILRMTIASGSFTGCVVFSHIYTTIHLSRLASSLGVAWGGDSDVKEVLDKLVNVRCQVEVGKVPARNYIPPEYINPDSTVEE